MFLNDVLPPTGGLALGAALGNSGNVASFSLGGVGRGAFVTLVDELGRGPDMSVGPRDAVAPPADHGVLC